MLDAETRDDKQSLQKDLEIVKERAAEVLSLMTPPQTKQKTDSQFCWNADRKFLLCLNRK